MSDLVSVMQRLAALAQSDRFRLPFLYLGDGDGCGRRAAGSGREEWERRYYGAELAALRAK